MQLVLDGFLGLLFFIWIVRMQLRTRTLRQRTNPLFYVIIGLIGVIQIVTSVQHGTLNSSPNPKWTNAVGCFCDHNGVSAGCYSRYLAN